MTASLRVIAAEAAAAHARVQALQYDPLDAAETGFVADVAAYRATLQELERRLATIIAQVHLCFLRSIFSASDLWLSSSSGIECKVAAWKS